MKLSEWYQKQRKKKKGNKMNLEFELFLLSYLFLFFRGAFPEFVFSLESFHETSHAS